MDDVSDMSILEKCFKKFYPIGQDDIGGVTRLGYSIEEDEMHKAFKEIADEMELNVETDSVGNSFAYIKGFPYEKYHLVGSHLDSVPHGGRYDGVCGVLSGLLILKWIKDNKLDIPLKAAAFRCEESSAFGRATIGSSLAVGKITDNELRELRNDNNESLYDILKILDYSSNEHKLQNIIDYIELHIEQGRVLWEKGIDVGIVNSIAAPKRFKLSIKGRQDHSGATPMGMRKNALCAAAEVILETERLGAMEKNKSTVATVGKIKETPNVMNVVPGFAELGIDIRGINKDSISFVVCELKKKIEDIMARRNLKYELKMISSSDPVKLSDKVIKNLEKAASKQNIDFIEMPSGAGHDAMELAEVTNAGMVFIPCEEGISHNIYEKADLRNVLKGSKIIFEYLKEASL